MVDYELCGRRMSVLLEVIKKNDEEDKKRQEAYFAASRENKEGKAS